MVSQLVFSCVYDTLSCSPKNTQYIYACVFAIKNINKSFTFNCNYISSFNALVSKTVNKHGGHAISISGHTRHFYPTGYGVKIAHFFPEKHHEETHNEENQVDKEIKPVNDYAKEKPKMVLVDGGKMMLLESIPVTEPIKVDTVKTEESDVKVMPVVSHHAYLHDHMSESSKMKDDTSVIPVVEKTDTVDNLQTIDESNKDATSTDSEVASSYYRSKYYRYYVGY